MRLKRRSTEADAAIGKNLKFLRLKNGLSQEEVAEIIDVSFQQVQKYEKGVNRLSAANLLKISEKIGEPLEAFYLGASSEQQRPLTELEDIDKDILEIVRCLQKIPQKKVRKQLRTLLENMLNSDAENEKT